MGLPSSGRFLQGGYSDLRLWHLLSAGSQTTGIQNHGALPVNWGRGGAQREKEDPLCCTGLCTHQPGPSASGDGEQAADWGDPFSLCGVLTCFMFDTRFKCLHSRICYWSALWPPTNHSKRRTALFLKCCIIAGQISTLQNILSLHHFYFRRSSCAGLDSLALPALHFCFLMRLAVRCLVTSWPVQLIWHWLASHHAAVHSQQQQTVDTSIATVNNYF